MSDSHDDHFIVPVKYYIATLVSLLVLTVVTVGVALVDFGSFNTLIALGIAVVKATIVLCVFMGLYWDESFNRVIVIGSATFFALFVGFLLIDVATRDDVYSNEGSYFDIESPVKVVDHYSSHHGDDHHDNDADHNEKNDHQNDSMQNSH